MKLLVPFDFTPITESALQHALKISDSLSASVELLHIVSKESLVAEAEQKLAAVVAELLIQYQERVSISVKVGDIFKDIAAAAEQEASADLIVMGTHGAKGMQKLLGSHAIKVVTSAKVPFIITQEKLPESEISRIVLPVSLSKESLQIVKYSTYLAKQYGAEIHVVYEEETDEFLLKKLTNNMILVKKHFAENKVDYKLEPLKGSGSLQEKTISYGAKNRADLFAIAYFSDSVLPQFDRFAQDMITNNMEIPVLIVSTHQIKKVNTNYSFIGI